MSLQRFTWILGAQTDSWAHLHAALSDMRLFRVDQSDTGPSVNTGPVRHVTR